MREKNFQQRVTAGRFTLPAVIFISAFCWVLVSWLFPVEAIEANSYPLWGWIRSFPLPPALFRAGSFLLYALAGYLLIQLNNAYALIRRRASVQTSVYLVLVAACPQLYMLHPGNLSAVAFVLALFFLFRSYQKVNGSADLFYCFASLGMGSIFFPQLLWTIPVWLIGAYNMQSLSLRSFLAAVLGWMLPYWFLLGHAVWHGQMYLFYAPFRALAGFSPLLALGGMPVHEMALLALLFVLFAVAAVHSLVTTYSDKIQTRSYLNFLILLTVFLFLFVLLQPAYATELLSLSLVSASVLVGHLFVLSRTRSSNYFFIGTAVVLAALFVFNLWMLL